MNSPRVAIIGAGFSGIGMAIELLRSGISSVTIFERLSDAGGCWRSNAFPGAEVDTDSDVYRFSFKPYPWSRSHARRAEILTYFEEAIDDYGLRPRIRFDTAVESVVWQGSGYVLTAADGTTFDADVVISAVGLFAEPNIPPWPGIDTFSGDVVHTAEWREEVDLVGKRVAVVGTGSTSASLVPAIAESVEQLHVFQREPGWLLPKPIVEFTDEERRRRSRPLAAQWHRATALYRIRKSIKGGRAKKVGTAQNKALQRDAESFIEANFGDRPDLLEALTPGYPVYGKRLVRSSDFYPALALPNVELVPRGVTSLTGTGIVDEDGVERRVDVVVLATGFRASEFLSGMRVVGRDGLDLHEFWGQDPCAFLGMTIPGFPNFFVMYGPNTNGSGAHLFVLECQMRFIAGALGRMARSGTDLVEVRPRHFRVYQDWLARQWKDSALLSTHNYFRSASGQVVTNWPRGFGLYYVLTRVGRYTSLTLSRREPGST